MACRGTVLLLLLRIFNLNPNARSLHSQTVDGSVTFVLLLHFSGTSWWDRMNFAVLKLKLSRYTPWRRLEERSYSSYSFSASALDGVSGQRQAPAALYLPPGKGPPVPIVQEAGWAPEPVWAQRLQEKSFRLCRGSNLNRQVVQPVARHYTA
jgi:hypothetical protein